MRVRWEDTDIRVYLDDTEETLLKATSFSVDDVIETDTAKYQGESAPRKDGHYMGGRGNIEFRYEKGFGNPSTIFEKHKTAIRNRTSDGRVDLVVSRIDPVSLAREALRLENCILNSSARVSETEPWSESWAIECDSVNPA